MGRLILIAGLCLAITSLASAYQLMCYIEISSTGRTAPADFSVPDVDGTLCTHLVVAHADIDGNDLVANENDDLTFYTSVTNLKNDHSSLKVLLSVGGADFDTQKFSDMAATDVNRGEFTASAITFLRDNNFDGLMLDWRYPHETDDKDRFTTLCEELSDAFDGESSSNTLLLGAAVSGMRSIIDESYDIGVVAGHLDLINVMAYDYYNANGGQARHPSPLFKGNLDSGEFIPWNAANAMMYWKNKGADAEKLLLGVAAYGRTFVLASGLQHGIGHQTLGAGEAGTYTNEDGFLSYFEICSGDFEFVRLESQKVSYGHHEEQWVGLENVDSVGDKATFVINYSFGGVAFWSLDLDDFNDDCGDGNYPLLTNIRDVLSEDITTIPSQTAEDTGSRCPLTNYRLYCIGMDNGLYSVPGYPTCYFNCWNDETELQDCPGHQTFDEECECCVDDDSYADPDPCPGEENNFCAGKGDGHYSVCSDQTKFYQCAGGLTYIHSCPANTVWDVSTCVMAV